MASLDTELRIGGRGGGGRAVSEGLDAGRGVVVVVRVDGVEVGGRSGGGGGRKW